MFQVVDVEIEKDIPKVKREKSSSATKIKKEIGTNDSLNDVSTHEMPVPMEVKTEPVEDHDYGRSTCLESSRTSSQSPAQKQLDLNNSQSFTGNTTVLSHGLSSVTETLLLGQNQVQTVVSPSIITTQPLTLIPVGSALQQNTNFHKMFPVTPPKNNLIQVQTVSPGVNVRVTSPSKNLVLKGVGSLSASNIGGNKTVIGGIQNTLIQVSPTKSPSAKNNFVVPQPVILTNVPGNQQHAQTGLHQTSPQAKGNKAVNQSQSSNLIFLKCTDNQGKTYLIPQQIGTSVATLPKGNKPGQVRVASPATQPVLLTTNLNRPEVKHSAIIPSSLSQVNTASYVQNTKVTVTQSIKSPVENGPVLFIKPDNNLNKRLASATLVRSNCVAPVSSLKASGNLQFVQSAPQNVNILNLKTGKQTAVCTGNQSLVRGQLKVTSQGLIQVQGQLQQQQAAKSKAQFSAIEQKITVNGGATQAPTLIARPKQQPLILLPSNNSKLDVLQGKGKSLLNKTVTSLQVPQSNGSVFVLNQSTPSSNGTTLGKVVLNPSGIISNTEQKTMVINSGKDLKTDIAGEKSKQKQQNHILIVPVSSNATVAMETKDQTNAKNVCISKVNTTPSNGKINVDRLDSESHNRNLIVVKNDKTPEGVKQENSQGKKLMSSLINSKSVVEAMVTDSSDIRETPVTIKSSDSSEKKVIVVNKEDISNDRNWSDEKKIMLDPKRKRLSKPVEVKEKETIPPLRCVFAISYIPLFFYLIFFQM